VAIDLGVHQVAQADECPNQGGGDHNTVKRPEHGSFGDQPAVYPQGNQNPRCSSVTGQPSVPNLQNLPRML